MMKIRIVAAIAIQLLLTLTGIGQSGKIGSPVKSEKLWRSTNRYFALAETPIEMMRTTLAINWRIRNIGHTPTMLHMASGLHGNCQLDV